MLALGVTHGSALAAPTPPERIVPVVIDTLRRDHVSAYGGSTPTPNIDGLAARGTRMDEALSSFHQTTMSMGSLFTGHTPSLESGDPTRPLPWNGRNWCGLRRFAAAMDIACVPVSVETLAEKMRKAGYWTLGVASHALLFRPAGFDRGFDRWIEVGRQDAAGAGNVFGFGDVNSRDGRHVNEAVARALPERPGDKLFLYVHYMEVHDYEFRRERYATAVRRADRAVGGLLASLIELGLLDGAVVFVTSDHGERLGERHFTEGKPQHRGNPSFEQLVRVPLVVSPALPIEPDRLLRSEDLHRLIVSLAGGTGGGSKPPAAPELFLS